MQSIRFLLVIGLLAAAGCRSVYTKPASTPAATPPYALERFRQEVKLEAGVDMLVLDNPYGEIQVRQTSASALAFEGVEQRIGVVPRIARIEPFHDATRQGVRVRYAEHDAAQPANPRLGRVDLYAFVPKNMKLDLRSDFGTITVRRVDNDIRVRTRTGLIVAATRGALDAESVSGDIRSWTMQAGGATPTRISTAGNVIIDVPLFDDLTLEVESARGIRADFPLTRIEQMPSGRWQAVWKNGTGKHRTRIDSSQGDVILQALRKPVP